MLKKFSLLLASSFLFLFVASSANACVGKSLVIGSLNTPSLSTISEMMGILITERTGTTVVVKYFDSFPALADAEKKGQVDVMVDYAGRCYVDVLGKAPVSDEKKIFSVVKEDYQRDMNLVWLEPFGFHDAGVVKGNTPAFAAPVIRKDTLSKFPALPRVISKLAGKVDNAIMAKLVSEGGANGKTKKATRKFLKDNRLI